MPPRFSSYKYKSLQLERHVAHVKVPITPCVCLPRKRDATCLLCKRLSQPLHRKLCLSETFFPFRPKIIKRFYDSENASCWHLVKAQMRYCGMHSLPAKDASKAGVQPSFAACIVLLLCTRPRRTSVNAGGIPPTSTSSGNTIRCALRKAACCFVTSSRACNNI